MKTSIFNMAFTLPPLVEMTEVEKGATVNSPILTLSTPDCLI